MSYDASNAYNPKEALDAYRSLFKGQILMGVEVPPEAWVSALALHAAQKRGLAVAPRRRPAPAANRRQPPPPLPLQGGHVITIPEAQDLSAYVRSAGGDGMMIWSLQKPGTPSAQDLSTAICNTLGMGGCAAPLWP